jgi:hypothetical protein
MTSKLRIALAVHVAIFTVVAWLDGEWSRVA